MKMKFLSLAIIGTIFMSSQIDGLAFNTVDNSGFTKENNIIDLESIPLSSIISEVTIENEGNIYAPYSSAKASLKLSNDKVEYITIDEVRFKYNKTSNLFEGKLKNIKSEEIVVYYKNGLKQAYKRDETNNKVFKKLDINLKKIELIDIEYDKTENIEVGDKVKVTVTTNVTGDSNTQLDLNYEVGEDGYFSSRLDYIGDGKYSGYIKRIYHEGPGLDQLLLYKTDAIEYEGKYKLYKVVVVKEDSIYDFVTDVIATDRDILEKYDFYTNQYKPIKEIYYLRDKFLAEVIEPEKVDSIEIHYYPETKSGKYYRLTKNDEGLFEGDAPKYSRERDRLSHIRINKSNGGTIVYEWNTYPEYSNRLNLDLSWDDRFSYKWIYLKNNWYYYKNGEKQKGWQKDSDKWYYLDESGIMQTGWEKVNGTWYYLNSSGAMVTGWQKISGVWYYLKPSGAMATGWQKISGKWYYLYSSGAMAKNTTINGYKINSSGVAINKK